MGWSAAHATGLDGCLGGAPSACSVNPPRRSVSLKRVLPCPLTLLALGPVSVVLPKALLHGSGRHACSAWQASLGAAEHSTPAHPACFHAACALHTLRRRASNLNSLKAWQRDPCGLKAWQWSAPPRRCTAWRSLSVQAADPRPLPRAASVAGAGWPASGTDRVGNEPCPAGCRRRRSSLTDTRIGTWQGQGGQATAAAAPAAAATEARGSGSAASGAPDSAIIRGVNLQ